MNWLILLTYWKTIEIKVHFFYQLRFRTGEVRTELWTTLRQIFILICKLRCKKISKNSTIKIVNVAILLVWKWRARSKAIGHLFSAYRPYLHFSNCRIYSEANPRQIKSCRLTLACRYACHICSVQDLLLATICQHLGKSSHWSLV